MKNFFNAMGVANVERIHSAMIAWILNDENDHPISPSANSNFCTFSINERSKLLCEMFDESKRTFKSIKTYVEWNDIDILIETEDSNGLKEVWVIENKLKAQEHQSNIKINGKNSKLWQTEKYFRVIQNDNTYSTQPQHYMLLSLGGDKAKCISTTWKSYTYDQLAESLESLLKTFISFPNLVLIREYYISIKLLVSELNNFLNDPNKYPEVFGQKQPKANKVHLNLGSPARYILENGLETIFQKLFLKKMVSEAANKCKLLNNLNNNLEIDEDNGIAECGNTIAKLDQKGPNINGDLLLQIQFQDGTFKVAVLHEDYRNAKNPKDYYDMIYGANAVWEGKFNSVNVAFGWKLQTNKNQITGNKYPKPRIALTGEKIKDWYNDLDAFIEGYKEAYNLAKKIIEVECKHVRSGYRICQTPIGKKNYLIKNRCFNINVRIISCC